MFLSYFIHFHFANPVVFPEFTLWNESAHHKVKQLFDPVLPHMVNLLHFFGGGWSLFFRFSGGDSENITRSPAAVQIGCGGACRVVLICGKA
jgi:hypothetical protein